MESDGDKLITSDRKENLNDKKAYDELKLMLQVIIIEQLNKLLTLLLPKKKIVIYN